MKLELECMPCIMKQAYNTARRSTVDENIIREILDRTAEYVATLDMDQTPADASYFAYLKTRELTGNADPYKKEKRRYNDICLSIAPDIRKRIDNSDDPLYTAIKAAIFGNLIDLGIGFAFDIEKDMETIFSREPDINDYEELKAILRSGRKKILYLGDNAGEIVFDRLFIEKIKDDHDVTFVVKKGPIINDATMEDAVHTGITDIVRVIDTGSDGIGVKWSEVSDEFREMYDSADLIISKGQGNFETNSDKRPNIFFLLKAKCESVARKLNVDFGDIVIKKGPVH
ncbi:DUF89 domain-containing protein [Candidatus Latescibacterota bacterium]